MKTRLLGFVLLYINQNFLDYIIKKLKEFIGTWIHERDFDKKWEETREYIKNYKDE